MSQAFDRDALLDAFDRIGFAAVAAKTRLQIAVYGGSAKFDSKLGMILSENRKSTFRDHALLASNFRFSTEDVDIAEIGSDWPDWLKQVVADIARDRRWGDDWFNDGVTFHLSALADARKDHQLFGTFPRRKEEVGLTVFIPSLRYMLAMKLKSLRVSDFHKGELDMEDVSHLLRAANITDVEQAIDILRDYFPRSAANAEKQRFVVKRLLSQGNKIDAPEYPRGSN